MGFTCRWGLLAAAGMLASAVAGLASPVAASAAPLAGRPAVVHAVGQPHAIHATGTGRGAAARRSASLRSLAGRSPAATRAPAARYRGLIASHAAAALTANFDGISQSDVPHDKAPDPSAATNGSQILTTTNDFVRVYNNQGAILCGGGVTLRRLLRSSDTLGDPRVQYDNVAARFSLVATIIPAFASDTAALYVAASTTSDPCGTWNVYRLPFTGSLFPAGTLIDFPTMGQDRRALLFGTTEFDFADIGVGRSSSFTVFAIPKLAVYAGTPVPPFPIFEVRDLATPVSNAGIPMMDSTYSYFLTHETDSGYGWFQMVGSGSPSPRLFGPGLITAPYPGAENAPQPGAGNPPSLDALDGRIPWSPVFDGTRIWFAHGSGTADRSTDVLYGFIKPADNSIVLRDAFHSSTSADLNPSLGVGLNPNGTETVFLNWAYTDVHNNIPASDAVRSFTFFGDSSMPANGPGDQTLVTGVTETETGSFGDFSSVAIDPAVADGTCAITAQEYFPVSNRWNTRLARVCGPQTATVPDMTGQTTDQAATALQAVGLTVGTVSTTPICSVPVNTIDHTSPPAGTVLAAGRSVDLSVCSIPPATVPDVSGDTIAQALQQLTAAGLILGIVSNTPDHLCTSIGKVMFQSPAAGTAEPTGTPVSITVGQEDRQHPCQ